MTDENKLVRIDEDKKKIDDLVEKIIDASNNIMINTVVPYPFIISVPKHWITIDMILTLCDCGAKGSNLPHIEGCAAYDYSQI